MKMIRCTLHPFQLDQVADALGAFDIVDVTMMNGGQRCENVSGVFRGFRYKVRFLPASILDITAADDQIDGIVRAITAICSRASENLDADERRDQQARVFVTPVEEWYTLRPWPRRVA
jgi:nitrogen regulatory protein PII